MKNKLREMDLCYTISHTGYENKLREMNLCYTIYCTGNENKLREMDLCYSISRTGNGITEIQILIWIVFAIQGRRRLSKSGWAISLDLFW